jgi:hypothetical protein
VSLSEKYQQSKSDSKLPLHTDIAVAAAEYQSLGLPVLSLVYGTKRPATKRGYLDASADAAEVGAMFATPRRNIGIRTGGQLLVLDVDPRSGGLASIDRLTALHGPLPATARVNTRDGGYHLYLRLPAGGTARCGPLRGYEGIDVKAEGGYVVAPPSRHPSGATYTWAPGAALREVGMADVPGWLLQLLPAVGGTVQGRATQARGMTPAALALAEVIAEAIQAPLAETPTGVRIGRAGSKLVTTGEHGPRYYDFEAGCGGGVGEAIRQYGIDRRALPLELTLLLDGAPIRITAGLEDRVSAEALWSAWRGGVAAGEMPEDHPAIRHFVAGGIPAEVFTRTRGRIGRLASGPAYILPREDLSGEISGLVAWIAGEEEVDYVTIGDGLVCVVDGDDPDAETIITCGALAGLAGAAARSARRVLAAVDSKALRRVVVPADTTKLLLVLPASVDARAIGRRIWRQSQRLEEIAAVKVDLPAVLRGGGREAAVEALAAAERLRHRRWRREEADEQRDETPFDGVGVAARVGREVEIALRTYLVAYRDARAAGQPEKWKKLRRVIKACAGSGKTSKLLSLVKELGIKDVIVAMPTYKMADQALRDAREFGLAAEVIRSKGELIGGVHACGEFTTKISKTRNEKIEIGERVLHCERNVKDPFTKEYQTVSCQKKLNCLWQLQFAGADVTFVTHQSLFSPPHPSLPADGLLVIDERIYHWDLVDIDLDDLSGLPEVVQDLLVDISGEHLVTRDWVEVCADKALAEGRFNKTLVRLAAADAKQGCTPRERTSTQLMAEYLRALAHFRRAPEEGMPLPDATPEQIDRWIAELKKEKRQPQIAALLNAVATWIDSGRGQAYGVRYNPQTKAVEWDHLKAIDARWADGPVLALDASDRVALRLPMLRDAETIVVSGPRNARIIQLADRDIYKGVYDDAAKVNSLNDFISARAAGADTAGVIAQLDAFKHLDLPANAKSLHFNALRGRNDLEDCNLGFVLGRVLPTSNAIDRIVRALDPDQALPGRELLREREEEIRARNGQRYMATVRRCDSPLHDVVLRAIREDELSQAIDRFRLIHRRVPAVIFLLTNVPLADEGIVPDELISWTADVAETERVIAYARSVARGAGQRPTVILLSKKAMADYRSPVGGALFATLEAAKQAKKNSRFGDDLDVLTGDDLFTGERCQISKRIISLRSDTALGEIQVGVRYRVKGQGGDPAPALVVQAFAADADVAQIRASITPDAVRQLLEERLGRAIGEVRICNFAVAEPLAVPPAGPKAERPKRVERSARDASAPVDSGAGAGAARGGEAVADRDGGAAAGDTDRPPMEEDHRPPELVDVVNPTGFCAALEALREVPPPVPVGLVPVNDIGARRGQLRASRGQESRWS